MTCWTHMLFRMGMGERLATAAEANGPRARPTGGETRGR